MDSQTLETLVESIHHLYAEQYKHSSLEQTPPSLLKETLRNTLQLGSTGSAPPEERDVTILLSDLRGFTAMSESYSPLEIIDFLNRYFTVMTRVIRDHGGTIDKFMGDSIMVVFGSPRMMDDDLLRALRCAVNMQIELGKMNTNNEALGYPPLYMGIGINTGKVVAGRLGSDLYSEYTVIGDHVNLASRVESYSLRGQILLSENSYEAAKKYIEIGQVNSLEVKGKKSELNMYELLAVTYPERLDLPKINDRKSPRIEVYWPINFQLLEGKTVPSQLYSGEIIDLSYGGMYVSSTAELPKFAEIKFPFTISPTSDLQSDIYARVIRTNPVPGAFHYHFEFTSISSDAEKVIRGFINRVVETA